MNSAIGVGPAAKQAFRFLRGIHRDTLSVIETVDSLFGDREWYPTQVNRISGDLSNGLGSADKWLITSLYRIYVNNAKRDTADRAVALHITFDPPDAYDQPVCLCMAVRFPRQTSTDAMWGNWDYPGSERLLEFLPGKDQPQPIPEALLKRELMPQAASGMAFVVNLCDLTQTSAVQEILVAPLLDKVVDL